jgi:tetratricopeptide (TPR) repeat protein
MGMGGARGFVGGRPGMAGAVAGRGGIVSRAPMNAVGGAGRGFGNAGFANRGVGNVGFANRGFGNASIANNRSFGNQGVIGGNRINNINQSTFVANRGGFNRGGYGGYGGGYRGYRSYGGYGYGRGYGLGGYGRYGGYGFGYGGLGYGLGGYGFGGGFGLGLLLGYGLGGFGGYGLGGYGGYGGYGGGYGGYGGGYGGSGGYSSWGYPGYGYDSSYGAAAYMNPYLTTGYSTQPYDYSQAIPTVASTPVQSSTDQALALFGQARDAFKSGDVTLALQQADAALAQNPNDTSLHEFRALCLFALGRYDEAAVPLYAVLAIGPGWDWSTLIGLYPNVEVYTSQLRRLEGFVKANPQSSASLFVLAYQYLTEGFNDAAANQLKQVIALKPNDAVATKLLQQMNAPTDVQGGQQPPPNPEPVASPASSSAPINTTVPEGATITGTWTAKPNADTAISLTIQPGGEFRWDLNLKGQAKQFAGTSTFANGILTLVPENIPPIVGKVSWADVSHLTFRAVGDNAQAPGLSFSKL